MTDRGVSDYDMPHRTEQYCTDVPGVPDAAFTAVLAGETPALDAPASLRQVADVLGALRAEPASDEMAGRDAALAEFRRRVIESPRHSRSHRIGPAALMPLLRTRARAATAAALVGVGGFAIAAYADVLPAVAQAVAHDTIGAPRPAPAHHGNPAAGQSGTPVGPDASGSARFGLCTAYLHGKAHGSAAEKSVAFRNLEKAAGGAANVPSYCARVPHPGASTSNGHRGVPQSSDVSHPTGKPPHP